MTTINEITSIVKKSNSLPIMILGVGVVFFAVGPLNNNEDRLIQQIVLMLGATITLAGLGIELMGYLQSVRQTSSASPKIDVEIERQIDPINKKIASISSSIDSLKNNNSNISFTREERDNLLEKTRENLTGNIASHITNIWESKYKDASLNKEYSRSIEIITEETRRRLQQEVYSLGRRANVNLVLGTIISLFGIGLLWNFIFATTTDIAGGVQLSEVAIRFSIRFSLVIVVQIFAYFFLRLYRYSIFETKYFQNEITNVDLKIISLKYASMSPDKKLLSTLCSELIGTERNFILKKGETTVGLRRDEMELQHENDVLSKFERIMNVKNSTAKPAKVE